MPLTPFAWRGLAAALPCNVEHAHIRSRNYVESFYAALVTRHFPIRISTPYFFGGLGITVPMVRPDVSHRTHARLLHHRSASEGSKLPLNKDQVYDMIVYAAVGVFAGGRLGYVLFYNLS